MCLRRVAAALLLAGNALAAAPPRPEIRVATGVLRGTTTDGVASFRNTPYAGAPIGPLRWHSPEPALPWKDVRDATRSGPASYQELVKPWDVYGPEFIEPGPVSEDCLTLNVWKPVTAKRALPVYVYIHGGGFRGGSGALPIYDGAMLARRGVVVVTINYRVGVFGFLAHPAFTRNPPGGRQAISISRTRSRHCARSTRISPASVAIQRGLPSAANPRGRHRSTS